MTPLLLAIVIFATPAVPPARAIPNVTAYLDVDLRFEADQVTVVKIKKGRFGRPTALPRFRGRFTLIVAKAKRNLAEVDFDFPGLAAGESQDATEESRTLAKKLRKGITTTTTVRVPLPDGADSLSVYDAVTRKVITAEVSSAAPAGDPRAP